MSHLTEDVGFKGFLVYNRADGSQLALLSATEDDSFHPLAVIETIKRLGDLRSAAFRSTFMPLCVLCS